MKPVDTPWDAISAYLNDQSDRQSEAVVKAWLKASPEHIQMFAEILNTQKLTGKSIGFYKPKKEELWNELLRRISPETKKQVVAKQLWLRYIAVAAALIVAFFAGNWFTILQRETPIGMVTYSEVIAPAGHRTQMILPDSTKVWLNSGAELKYANLYDGESRDVYIKGECYFEVTKNKHKPFVVHASNVNVKVYGTHFNVKENAKGNQSTVTLLEGKVEVLNPQNESLSFLNPGQQFQLAADGAVKISETDKMEALIAWTNGMLVFEDLPFEEVINYLESWYGVKIKLDLSLSNKHNYTFKVKTESLHEVLDLISVITPIDYKIEGDSVLIKKKKS